MATIIIVHGLGGNSVENWFPWLKGELEKLGHSVIVPDFPDSNVPKLDSWLAEFHKLNKVIDSDAILIGHSLGCPFILSALELRSAPIKATFLVAGFADALDGPELNSLVSEFVMRDFDWERIRGNCGKFYVISSDNDPYVPLSKAHQLALNLATEVIVMKGKGHFNFASFSGLLGLVENEL